MVVSKTLSGNGSPRKFCHKAFAFFKSYFDILLLVYFFLCLKDYQYFFEDFKYPPQAEKWWEWPMYDDWNINGIVPRYGEYKRSSVSLELDKEKADGEKWVKVKKGEGLNEEQEKIILFNYPPFDEKKQYIVDEQKCGGKCIVSYDTSLYEKADVVVFHFSDPKPIPERRSCLELALYYCIPSRPRQGVVDSPGPYEQCIGYLRDRLTSWCFPNQLYVWMSQESPSTTFQTRRENFSQIDRVFNLTMTYRRDSDIYFPYNTLHEVRDTIRKSNELEDVDLLLSSKDKLAVWAAGNCGYTKGGGVRSRLMLNFLILGLDVDAFGICVFHSLPGGWKELPQQLRRYKFYFSFENALHCRDYITEKLWWNSLTAGAVPVIWGPLKSDVEAVIPKGSFIFVEDFANPQELVAYLQFLDADKKAYRKFFEWRFEPLPHKIPGRKGDQKWLSPKVTGFCQLCHMLYDDDRMIKERGMRPQRIVKSLSSWWYEKETKTCLTPRSRMEITRAFWYQKLLNQEYYYKSFTYMPFYRSIYLVLILIVLIRRIRILYIRGLG